MKNINVPLVISAITLIVTISYYYKVILMMEMSQELTLFNTLHTEYSSIEMMEAFHSIEEFRTKIPPNQIACAYIKEKTNNTKIGITLDRSRRRILHWYQKMVYFHKFNLLNHRFFNELPGKVKVIHFLDAVEPLALASCSIYKVPNCTTPFDYLRKIYNLPKRIPIDCLQENNISKDQMKKLNQENKPLNKEDL